MAGALKGQFHVSLTVCILPTSPTSRPSGSLLEADALPGTGVARSGSVA
jgi:hypothetical protein